MVDSDGTHSDEKLVRQLLEAHLSESGRTGFHCRRNSKDPPDLVVAWENGSCWGVEVTRLYQYVQQITANLSAEPVSSEEVRSSLNRFGKQLGEETEPIRSRDYTLFLSSPGEYSRWRRPQNYNTWKGAVRDAVIAHVRVGGTDRLEMEGCCLRPGSPGKRWTVAVDHGAIDVASTLQDTLRIALSRKAADLPNWNGIFTERWLVLLIADILLDDYELIDEVAPAIIQSVADSGGFHRIAWISLTGRALRLVPGGHEA
jgi:hypothetical protein